MGVFSSIWKTADQAKKGWKSSGGNGKKKRKGSRKGKRR